MEAKLDIPTTIIIIGVTGDLSRRYLLPALEEIAAAGQLPQQFRIIGTTRQALSRLDVTTELAEKLPFVSQHLTLRRLDPTKAEDYSNLRDYLDKSEQEDRGPTQRLIYLSIPPQISWPVIELLGTSGLNGHPRTKLLLEKPFGTDLESAHQLIDHVNNYFKPEMVYRIDHYLAKEMAQNLIVFRTSNPLFQHTWNNNFIERIDISISESIDIEGRTGFYEQTGALRDVMQSHGLQLAALVLMSCSENPRDIPKLRLEALRQLRLPNLPFTGIVKRGQYETYRQEVDNPRSVVETYMQIQLESSDEQWRGVPIVIMTGKSLPKKDTSIRITYKNTKKTQPNQLILRIQPDAGIELDLWSKAPGYAQKLEKQKLSFSYRDAYPKLPDAYEQVLLDAVLSNRSLFTSSEEVLESWRILEPVQRAWALSSSDLYFYSKGTEPFLKTT